MEQSRTRTRREAGSGNPTGRQIRSVHVFQMKSYKGLWEQLITKENFELAYQKAIKGKQRRPQVIKFNRNKEENLEKIRQDVICGRFHTSKYREKVIFEPKERTIYKLPFSPDRIVQHAIMNILEPIMIQCMIQNTYACIKGRGQIQASQKCCEYVRKYQFCLKGDIHKFYPSIDQQVLSDKLHRIIHDRRFMALVDDVIFSFPGGKNCPIGNYMSQWCGNYYLSFLDNFVLHQIKPKGYERYCDDFLLFDNDKKKLHDARERIAVFLRDELKLTFSKAEVFDVKQGVDFCGYRSFKGYVLIRKRTARRMIRRFKKIGKKLEEKDCNLTKLRGQLDSANGLMMHACAHNLRRSVRYNELNDIIKERMNNPNEKAHS